MMKRLFFGLAWTFCIASAAFGQTCNCSFLQASAAKIALRLGVPSGSVPSTSGQSVGNIFIDTDDWSFLVWNGSAWVGILAASGAPTGSAGGDLAGTYPNPTVDGITLGSDAWGDVYYRGAAALARLPAGTSGYVLTTAGAGANPAWAAPAAGYTDEQAQDAVGAMVDTTIIYTDLTPLLSRAALTGDVTAAAGSNATTLAAGNAGNLNSGTLLAARMPALTGDVTTSAGAVATTIGADKVLNSMLANMPESTLKGRAAGAGTGDPTDLTAAQAAAIVAAGGGGTITGSGAANKLAIWSGASALTYDTLLHWDTTNNWLGIGGTPGAELHVSYAANDGLHGLKLGSAGVASGYLFSDDSIGVGIDQNSDGTTGVFRVYQNGSTSSELLRVQENGAVGIGTAAPASTAKLHVSADGAAPAAALVSTDYLLISAQNTAPGLSIVTASDTATHRGVFKSVKSKGTLASPTAAASGDSVFSLLGAIYDGSAVQATAEIGMFVDGAVSGSVAPQRIEFLTGTTTGRTTRVTIKGDGKVGMGDSFTAPLTRLHVRTGSAGTAFTPEADDVLTVEGVSTANAIIQLFSAATKAGGLCFTDTAARCVGQMIYDHSVDSLYWRTATVERVSVSASAAVFNDPGADVDFRVEGDTDPEMIFGNAGTDDVGIGVDPTSVTAASDLDIEGTIRNEAWTACTYENSWVDQGTTFNPCSYMVDKNGFVHLRGLVKNGSSATATIFTLPADYRPAFQEIHSQLCAVTVMCRVDITAAGVVACVNNGGSVCSTTYVSLDGITFRSTSFD